MASIFHFLGLKEFLKKDLAERVAAGDTWKALAERSGINSPNYFQQVIQGKRRLSDAQAEKAADGLGFVGHERKYFLLLAKLERAKTEADAEKIYSQMKATVVRAVKKTVVDPTIHSHWLHAIVFEMALVHGERFAKADVVRRLAGVASDAEAAASFDFLVAKKYLVKTDEGRYEQRAVQFDQLNDVRRIEIHQVHRRMLDMAKHKLNEDVREREFQGLTIAIPASRLPLIKDKIRKLMVELNDELSGGNENDTVVHVFAGAFKIVD